MSDTKDKEAKKSYIDQAFDGILVDRTRSADPEEEAEEKEEETEIFASTDEALQFLANITNSKIIIQPLSVH